MQGSKVLQATGVITQLLGWLEPQEQMEVVRSLANGYGIQPNGGLPPVYTDQQVADRYGISLYTVREWLNTGRLKGFKEARQWIVREPELAAFEESKIS